MMAPQVTILIPHYKTLELTQACLRSLNKYTDLNRVKVIVLDNGSQDASTEYLRTIDWITLVERVPDPGDNGSLTHCKSMDEGLNMTDTPYVLSIHTDTIVISHEWLDFLLKEIEAAPDIAGVGSWKLEHKPFIRRTAKQIEEFWQTKIWYPVIGKGDDHNVVGVGDNYYYLRSHCALYKTDLLKAHTKGFLDGEDTAGKVPHKKLVDAGYQMIFIPSETLSKHVRHLNHATKILNPEIAGKGTGSKKQIRRVHQEMENLNFKTLLAEDSLDQRT